MRPRYETPAHRSKESLFCQRLINTWRGVTAHRMPDSYELDFAITRGPSLASCSRYSDGIIAFLEVKCRSDWNISQFLGKGVFLSMHKYLKAKAFLTAGIRVLYAIEFGDGDKVCELFEHHRFPLAWSGRTNQTRDPADIEPIALVPVELFKMPERISFEEE